MSRSNIHLLDLPVEILLNILTRLNNVDVLYSLIGVQGLDCLASHELFTNTLNFVLTNAEDCTSIEEIKLNRFCDSILPRIHNNVQSLICDATILHRILRAGDYRNLTQLKISQYDINSFCDICTNELLFRPHFKTQIVDLTVLGKRENNVKSIDRTTNVLMKVIDFFDNLKHLNFIGSHDDTESTFSFIDLPSSTHFSSNLTKLCIEVDYFQDCLYLLDGRLTQLSTFIVIIHQDKDQSSIELNGNYLNNLKCLSLTYPCFTGEIEYDSEVVPLLRRMPNLQDLTLYIQLEGRDRLIDGIQLENDILIHLSKLQRFVFYIRTTMISRHGVTPLSNDDVQRAFTNFKFGEVGWTMNYFNRCCITYHFYSLPYGFHYIGAIGNQFTNTIYEKITSLYVSDAVPLEHEFFLRLAKCFPFLESLKIINEAAQENISAEFQYNNNRSSEIAEFPHLTSLDFSLVHIGHVEQLLNESKTRLPCLTELFVSFDYLKSVTNNFTRDSTRINCLNVRKLNEYKYKNDEDFIKEQHDSFYRYFPLLKI